MVITRELLIDHLQSGEPLIVGDGSLPTSAAVEQAPEGDVVLAADVLRGVLIAVAEGKVSGVDPRGLRLQGAAITGELDLGSMRIPHGLLLAQCNFDDVVLLTDTEIRGWLCMRGCHIGGRQQDLSLVADGLSVDSGLELSSGFATVGAVTLSGAHIRGPFVLEGARLLGRDADGWSLVAQRVRADNGLRATGLRVAGAVSLAGTRVTGQVVLRAARLEGAADHGWSLDAQSMVVSNDLRLDQPFRAAGAVTLHGAQIEGQIVADGAHILGVSDEGWSLDAQALQAGSDVSLAEGFDAAGAVTLHGAHVAGQLMMERAVLRGSVQGYSLSAQSLRVDSDVHLREGFETAGAVNLDGALIAGQLSLRKARLKGTSSLGWSLNGRNLRVDAEVIVGADTELAGTLRLLGSRLNRLVLSGAEPPPLSSVAGWQLGDISGPVRTDPRLAADWLASQKTSQPWLELAAFYDRIGQPDHARWIRYRSAVRSARGAGRWTKVGRWVSRATTGLGYYPVWRTLSWLVGIFLVAGLLAAARTDDFTTTTTPTIRQAITDKQKTAGTKSPPPIPGRVPASDWNDAWDTPEFQPWTYALSTAVPTTSSATSQPWTPRAGWLSAVLAGLRAASWIFAALFLAGITGLLRKQT